MARFNELSQWLAWQESCHPSAIDLGLTRVKAVAQRLNLLSPAATVITVAGTNGKGSCARALETAFVACAHTVGVYSSPHIHAYNERIRINGSMAADTQLLEAFDAIDQARGDISLTYFEFATLAAMHLFNGEQCDYWVLEVGLGGRLDATNILDADVAVVTSIGLDHCDWLGDTREAIGAEKVGICRPLKPFVCADYDPPASIVDAVKEYQCPSYWIGKQFDATLITGSSEAGKPNHKALDAGLGGDGRVENIGVESNKDFEHSSRPSKGVGAKVLFRIGEQRLSFIPRLANPSVAAALQVLSILGVSEPHHWAASLAKAHLPGRMERSHYRGCEVILDVAHNPAAFEFLKVNLHQAVEIPEFVVVLGMMADKDIGQSVAALSAVASHWVALPLNAERAASPATIKEHVAGTSRADFGETASGRTGSRCCEVALNAQDALARAASKGLPILVTGSFYAVAQVRELLIARTGERK